MPPEFQMPERSAWDNQGETEGKARGLALGFDFLVFLQACTRTINLERRQASDDFVNGLHDWLRQLEIINGGLCERQ